MFLPLSTVLRHVAWKDFKQGIIPLCFASVSRTHFIALSLFLKEPTVPESSGTQSPGSICGWSVSAGCDQLWGVFFFFFFYPSVITPQSWIHPVSLTKGLIFPTSADMIYSTQQKCLYIISPVVKQRIYIRNKHLVSNPPKCWGSNDAYSSCGDAVMGFRVVCMPSLGRAFLN